MKSVFKNKVANEFNKEINYNKIILKTKRRRSMKKGKYILAPACIILTALVGVIGFNINENSKMNENNEVLNLSDNIIINEINNMASAKLMADSKIIEKSELPQELLKITNINGNEVSALYAYYTKSDYSKEEFDVLHDYVFYFEDNENLNKNVKITASNVSNPLRDYFFQSSSDSLSNINGYDVKISKYEDNYIINFKKGDYNYDIETNSLLKSEMLNVLKEVLK